MEYNPNLKWQRNSNAEVGIEADFLGVSISLVGFYNKTKDPYKYSTLYTPFTYRIMQRPTDYAASSDNPSIVVDSNNGDVTIDGISMVEKVEDRTFVKSTYQDNGADITRSGLELTVDFPEIKPIKTSLRLDASYNYTKYIDSSLSYSYNSGLSHSSEKNRSYQYVGIYANGGSGSVYNGKETKNLDANLTSITHIPQARLIITCRLEMSILTRSRNLSSNNGGYTYAYTTTKEGTGVVGKNIYDANAYTAIWPVAYMDLEGNEHPFTSKEAALAEFSNLIIKSGNAYTFAQDGYGFYCSANLSITKEIGDHVSLSFFANNFTNSRPYMKSMATGVGAILTPAFYYGLTCRLKF